MLSGFCDSSELGRFILDLPSGKSSDDTSFWSARVQLPSSTEEPTRSSGLWDNPDGNPTPPPDPSGYTSPWKRGKYNPSPNATYVYDGPIQYTVKKTGYYCVGEILPSVYTFATQRSSIAIVPVTVQTSQNAIRADTDVSYHPSYHGKVLFRNKFDGQLPAADYPKVNVRCMQLVADCHADVPYLVLFRHVHRVHHTWRSLGLAVLPKPSGSPTSPGEDSLSSRLERIKLSCL